jgi:hypothetical protein
MKNSPAEYIKLTDEPHTITDVARLVLSTPEAEWPSLIEAA